MDSFNVETKLKVDTKEAEKKIDALAKKIKNMREAGPGGTMSQMAGQYRASGQDDKADRAEKMRQQIGARNRQSLTKDLKEQEKHLDKQQRSYEQMDKALQKITKGTNEHSQALMRRNKAQEEYLNTTNKIAQIQSSMNQGMNGQGLSGLGGQTSGVGPFSGREMTHIMRSGKMGGFRGGMGGVGRVLGRNPMAGLGILGAAMNATGRAISYGGDLAYQVGTKGERQTGKQAGIAGGLGELARLQEQRRGYEMQLYDPERRAAMDSAINRRSFSEMRDVTGSVGGVISGIGKGVGIGAGIGGALGGVAGFFAGGVGAVPGAALGAKLGAGIGGLFGGGSAIGDMAMDDTKRSMVTDRGFYDQIKTQEQFATYQEQLKFQKAKSYDKRQAANYFEKESGRFKGLQRGFGMSDEDLFLGGDSLFQRGTNAGFMTDTIASSMNSISGAGGTTRGSQEGSIYASQMARGLNLTNAGSLMGKISGGSGMGGAASKDELIRVYAEATRIGLDDSEFAKETRTFLDVAANMSYSSGASATNVAGMLGQGMGVYSERGIQASQNALEQLKQQTGSMGGLTGQYQIGELQSDEMNNLLGGDGFNLEETAMLSGMDITKVSGDDDYIKSLLKRRGIKADSEEGQAIIKQIKQGKVKSTLRTDEQQGAYEDYEQLLNNPMADPEALREAESKIRELGVLSGGEEESRRGILEQKSSARLKAGQLGDGRSGTPMSKADFEGKMTDGTGRLVDRQEKAQSVDDMAQLERLGKHSKELGDSFDKTTKQSIAVADAMAKLAENVDKNKEVFEEYTKLIKNLLDNPEPADNSWMKSFPSFGNTE